MSEARSRTAWRDEELGGAHDGRLSREVGGRVFDGDLGRARGDHADLSLDLVPADVVAVDGLADVPGDADGRLDDLPGAGSQVLQGVHVERVGHDHDERVAGEVDGDQVVLAGVLLRDEGKGLRLNAVAREVDDRQV